MQSYALNLPHYSIDRFLSASGNYLRYVKADRIHQNEIRVNASGLDIDMRPGMAVRLPSVVSDWKFRTADGSTIPFVDLNAWVIIGAGNVDDAMAGEQSLSIRSEGDGVVFDGFAAVVEQPFKTNGLLWMLGNTGYVREVSVAHDGASAASVDVYVVIGSAFSYSATGDDKKIGMDGSTLASPAGLFWTPTVTPPSLVRITRLTVPAKGGARAEFFLPPRTTLYFKPNVTGADVASNLSLSLMYFNP